ncbi:lipase [Aquimarina sp. W85]|uniref:lipase n=1 Tax=Aquimarina rhodophyticola TaxID=3342246 RepID=UPI00366F7988
MRIKPIQIAIFIILVLGALVGLMFLSHSNAIHHTQTFEDGIVVDPIEIKYPTFENFMKSTKDTVTLKSEIVKVTRSVVPVDDEESNMMDTLNYSKAKPVIKRPPDFSKLDTAMVTRIEYPHDNPQFLNSLKNKLSSSFCRIVHFGDSQIEGDRITGYLRNRLQGMYGGTGPGFIPVKPVYRQISAIVEPSDNWIRYAIFDRTKERFQHKKYGMFMSVSRFTPHREDVLDSLTLDSITVKRASIKIGKSRRTYFNFRKFKTIGLHYGNANYPIKITVKDDDIVVQEGELISDGQYHRYEIALKNTPTDLVIELEGKMSADFYGLTLGSDTKIQMDNVAMRGSSGTIFASSNASSFKQMAAVIQPKVIIMQYGGNTVPYLKDSLKVRTYVDYVKSQINWMRRRINKEVSFIFIGPTDMCIPVNGKMQTYPLLPYLNDSLRETCLSNNIAYWSMFDAMGGAGSMRHWVDQKLAGSDYTHFTSKGTKIISELFFTSLYLDLNATQNE